MNRSTITPTKASLLGRLHVNPDDPVAWKEFVTHYGTRVHCWCRAWGLQIADADDVTQIVLIKLARKLRDFHYDPSRSFRNWLKTLAHNTWLDYCKSTNKQDLGSGDSIVYQILNRVEARKTLSACLEEAFDEELLAQAMARVQIRVERRTWEAFRLMAEEGWTGVNVGKHLGMKVATVYVARSKVQRMLREELLRQEDN